MRANSDIQEEDAACPPGISSLIPDAGLNTSGVVESQVVGGAALIIACAFAACCKVDVLSSLVPNLAYKVDVRFSKHAHRDVCKKDACSIYRWTLFSQIIITVVLLLSVLAYIMIQPVIQSATTSSFSLIWTNGAALAHQGKVGCYESFDTQNAYWLKKPGGLLSGATYTRLGRVSAACLEDIASRYRDANRRMSAPLGCVLAAVLLLFFLHVGLGPLWPGVRGAYRARRGRALALGLPSMARGAAACLLAAGLAALGGAVYTAYREDPRRYESPDNPHLPALPAGLFAAAALLLGAGLWGLGHRWLAFMAAGIICIASTVLLRTGVMRMTDRKDQGEGITASVFLVAGALALSKSLRLLEG